MNRRLDPRADEKIPCDIAAGLGNAKHSPVTAGETRAVTRS